MPSSPGGSISLKSRAEVQLLNVLNHKHARSASAYLKSEQRKGQLGDEEDLQQGEERDRLRQSVVVPVSSEEAQLIAQVRQLEDDFFIIGANGGQHGPEVDEEGQDQERSQIELNAIRRRDRHMEAQMQYAKEVKEISEDMEVAIISAADHVKEVLATTDTRIKESVTALMNSELLLASDNEHILEMWRQMEAICRERTSEVNYFAAQLNLIEQNRIERVREGLQNLTQTLMETAHALPPEVERIIEAEAYEVNTVVISNRRVYADLVARMATADVDVLVSTRLAWENGQVRWRHLRHDHAITSFQATLNSALFTDPEERRRVLHDIRIFQENIHNERRLALLKQLKDAGAALSSERAQHILDALNGIQQEEEERNQGFFLELRMVHESKIHAAQTLQEALRLKLHGFGAMAKEGDISLAKDTLVGLLNDDSLEDFFRMAGGLRSELDTLAKQLNIAELIYATNLHPLMSSVEVLLSALPLEHVMETQGKGAERKAVQSTLEKIRKAGKHEIMSLLPPLQTQMLMLRNLDEMNVSFKTELDDIMMQLDAIIQEHGINQSTDSGALINSGTGTGMTSFQSATGASSDKTHPKSPPSATPPSPKGNQRRSSVAPGLTSTSVVAKNKLSDVSLSGSGVVDLPAIRRVQRRLGTLVYASELTQPLQQHLYFISDQLMLQSNANHVVDEVIKKECDGLIDTRQQESRLLLEEMGKRMERQSALLHEQSEKLAKFFLNVARCMEQSADKVQYVNLSVLDLLDTLKDEDEDAIVILEEQFSQSCSRLRHSPNDSVLREEFQRSSDLLMRIEGEYRMYHKRVSLAADNNVIAIGKQKGMYLRRLCSFFGLRPPGQNSTAEQDEFDFGHFLSAKYIEQLVLPPPDDVEAPGPDGISEASADSALDTKLPDLVEKKGSGSASTNGSGGPAVSGRSAKHKSRPTSAEAETEVPVPSEELFRASSNLELVVVLSLSQLAHNILAQNDDEEEGDEATSVQDIVPSEMAGAPIESTNPNGSQSEVDGENAHENDGGDDSIGTTEVAKPAALQQKVMDRVQAEFLCLEIPDSTIESLLATFRDAIVSKYDMDAAETESQTVDTCRQRYASSTLLLEERLRVHWPRKGRLDVQFYQPRMGELLSHQQRQERHLRGIWKKVNSQQIVFAKKAEEALAHVEETRVAQISSQAQLPLQQSLAALQGLEVKAKKRLGAFKSEGVEKLSVLRAMIESDINSLITSCQDYVRACSSQLFPDLTSCEIISGCDYHPEEIIAIQKKVAAMEAQAREQISERENRLAVIKESQDVVLGMWQTFKERYQACLQSLAMKEGLGQKFGLPRRAAQERYRSETTRCDERSVVINKLLTSLQSFICENGKNITLEAPSMGQYIATNLTERILIMIMQLRAKIYHQGLYFGLLRNPTQLELKPVEFDASAAQGKRDQRVLRDREVVDEEDWTLPVPFLEFVAQVSIKCREETKALYEQEGKGDELPQSGVPAALEEYLASQGEKARCYVLQQEAKYREQVDLFGELLTLSPEILLMDFLKQAKEQMISLISVEKERMESEYQAWMELKNQFILELRPHLCSPNNTALLHELGKRESNRSISTQETLREFRARVLAKQIHLSKTFEESLVALCSCLISLLDSSVMSLDDLRSFSGKEPPKLKRKSLKRLRKLARVNEFGDPQEVKRSDAELERLKQCGETPRYPLRSWPGIPAFGLTALWRDVKAMILSREAAVQADLAGNTVDKAIQELECGGSKEGDLPPNDGACTALLTPAHRGLIRARDNVYADYVAFCKKETQTLVEDLHERLQDELKWTQNWQQGIANMQQQQESEQSVGLQTPSVTGQD